jgi:hypothetical protein
VDTHLYYVGNGSRISFRKSTNQKGSVPAVCEEKTLCALHLLAQHHALWITLANAGISNPFRFSLSPCHNILLLCRVQESRECDPMSSIFTPKDPHTPEHVFSSLLRKPLTSIMQIFRLSVSRLNFLMAHEE